MSNRFCDLEEVAEKALVDEEAIRNLPIYFEKNRSENVIDVCVPRVKL